MIFSKGYGFLCEANGGPQNILSSTEHVIGDWDAPGLYPESARSHWVKMGSGGMAESNLDRWTRHVLPKITAPFILVTSDGDTSVPDGIDGRTLDAILSHPHLVRWYTQNHNEHSEVTDPRLVSLPIGLDAHTPSNLGAWRPAFDHLQALRLAAAHFDQATGKIFIDFGINQTSGLRGDLVRRLKWRRPYRILRRRVRKSKLLRLYAKHGYVLSVRGNGHDCHRTWEALALGARPIAYTPEINAMLRLYGVFTISDLAELEDPTLAQRAAAFYQDRPPRIPTFRDVFAREDWPYLNWNQPYVA